MGLRKAKICFSLLLLFTGILAVVISLVLMDTSCPPGQAYNASSSTCESCKPWQTFAAGACPNRCPPEQLFDSDSQTCTSCPGEMRLPIVDNQCTARCAKGKSFNRYPNKEGQYQECLNIYDMFDTTAKTNEVLITQKKRDKMGGSLSDELTCGKYKGIKTVYSEKMIPTVDMEYVEFWTTKSPGINYRIKMFVSKHDYEKVVKDVIDVNDS